ncbi:O-antigen ligase family protein [Planomonospora sp. ID82291]|uniref:O-antigen ligase family protein n=1 Tax=Planomonospora sp. ID82291 TaxID=2738136 RepID=UPI0018C3AF39|nr:O-antigen ligase family protein [Planomonospora sp. ID82291]MBG0814963.1 O-antigen ligase family protein [Planomonospora sp. ID82291]
MRGPHPASWPIAAFLVGYPVWWMLGFGGLAVIVLAPPMAVVLWRRRPVRVPKGFGIWLLLLAGYLVSALMLGEMPPDTYGEFGAGRVIGYLMRLALYLSLTIMVLYLGNLTEQELPQLALVRMLGALFVTTVAGGLLGVFAPHVQFTSPLERLLPGWISGNAFVQNLIHPTAAQMQKVLGHASPRPEAPFEWANAWGGNLSVLLVWFAVGWWVYGGPHRRLAALALLALASIPVVYSLNRGLWIGLGVAAAYLVLRTGARRRLAICAAVAAGALAFALSPLQPLVAQRLDNPHSNDIRAFTVSATIAAARTSPFIGYGNNRSARGNYRTITTGKSDWCDTCGHPPLGSDGQLWHLMITQGFVGAALYVAFFAGAVRRHWSDRSPIGMAGVLVMILTLLYMFVYDGLVTPLSLYLISFALLWRNTMARGATV